MAKGSKRDKGQQAIRTTTRTLGRLGVSPIDAPLGSARVSKNKKRQLQREVREKNRKVDVAANQLENL